MPHVLTVLTWVSLAAVYNEIAEEDTDCVGTYALMLLALCNILAAVKLIRSGEHHSTLYSMNS